MKQLSIATLAGALCLCCAGVALAAPREADASPSADVDRSNEHGDTLAVQVSLDRAGFSPGVIDGHLGRSTKLALEAFQDSRALEVTGELDDATANALAVNTIQATTTVTVDEASVGAIGGPLPQKPEEAAGLPAMPYASFEEALAEKYHTTPKALAELNPGIAIEPGETLTVPNVASNVDDGAGSFQPASVGGDPDASGDWQATLASLNVAPAQAAAAKIVINKARGDIRAFDASGRLIAAFPATIGSTDNPSPVGDLKITGVLHQPRFKYDSRVLGEKETRKQFDLSPGPNNLVGVVWLNLSKPHNGIHGTPNPELIGRAASHGCVRMTNWDAARLAQMVKPGTPVTFEGKKAAPRPSPI